MGTQISTLVVIAAGVALALWGILPRRVPGPVRARAGTAAVVGSTALVAVLAVEGAISPLLLSDTASSASPAWIGNLPLSERIQGIPFNFGAFPVYSDSLLRFALWGAGVVLAAIIGLAWFSAPERRRALALTGGLAAVVILVPLIGAEVGSDYLFSRNLMPAWIPVILLIAGAVGAERARPAGLALLIATAALFVWGQARVSADANLQRPNWRAVAQSLGPATVPRAVLIYGGNAAEGPLSIYLPGTTFSYSGAPAAGPRLEVGEIDVVAPDADTLATPLPAGVHVISTTVVDENYVERLALSQPRELTPQSAAALDASFVQDPGAPPSVLVQR